MLVRTFQHCLLYDETNYVENGDCTAVFSSSITFLFVTYFIVYALSRVPDSSLRILLMFFFVRLRSERLTDNFTIIVILSPSCIYFLTLSTKYNSLLTVSRDRCDINIQILFY